MVEAGFLGCQATPVRSAPHWSDPGGRWRTCSCQTARTVPALPARGVRPARHAQHPSVSPNLPACRPRRTIAQRSAPRRRPMSLLHHAMPHHIPSRSENRALTGRSASATFSAQPFAGNGPPGPRLRTSSLMRGERPAREEHAVRAQRVPCEPGGSLPGEAVGGLVPVLCTDRGVRPVPPERARPGSDLRSDQMSPPTRGPVSLAGRRTWVTGAAGGIGAAVCARCAEAGAEVVATDIARSLPPIRWGGWAIRTTSPGWPCSSRPMRPVT